MTTLAIFRHAKTVKNDPGGDHARGLTPEGRDAAAAAGRWLRDVVKPPLLVLASDARRTRQTAELAFPADRGDVDLHLEAGLYGASADQLLARLRSIDGAGAAVVVGHNPGIGDLALRLSASGALEALEALQDGFPTASVAVIEFEGPWREIGVQAGRLTALFQREDT